jgi:hypothetical protein
MCSTGPLVLAAVSRHSIQAGIPHSGQYSGSATGALWASAAVEEARRMAAS